MLLLFVLFSLTLCLGGCGRRGGEVYMAGLETELHSTELPVGPEANCQSGESSDTGEFGAGAENGAGSKDENEVGHGPETRCLPDKDSGSRANQETAGEDESADRETEGYVYVCGAVCHPGVYPMHSGMRVFEAVELAGGFAENADEDWVNQAGYLQDGQQLYICTKDETQQMQEAAGSAGNAVQQGKAGNAGGIMQQGTAGSAGSMMQQGTAGNTGGAVQQGTVPGSGAASQESSGMTDGKVNLNTADAETLMTLPGIGEVKAEAIIQYRTEHGAFSSIEEIQNIPGIKQAVFSKIEDRITV